MNSADAFLSALDRARPGCVVADVRMPGMDGIELTRELARRKISLPVVLISGHADVPMAVAAIKASSHNPGKNIGHSGRDFFIGFLTVCDDVKERFVAKV